MMELEFLSQQSNSKTSTTNENRLSLFLHTFTTLYCYPLMSSRRPSGPPGLLRHTPPFLHFHSCLLAIAYSDAFPLSGSLSYSV